MIIYCFGDPGVAQKYTTLLAVSVYSRKGRGDIGREAVESRRHDISNFRLAQEGQPTKKRRRTAKDEDIRKRKREAEKEGKRFQRKSPSKSASSGRSRNTSKRIAGLGLSEGHFSTLAGKRSYDRHS